MNGPVLEPLTTVHQGARSYPVYVGRELIGQLGELVTRHSTATRRFAVTSDSLAPLIGERLRDAAQGAELIVIPDGEEQKSLATVERVVEQLLKLGAQRDSVLIACGGGVVGDTAGFVASIYLRGIDLIHVPTTLLAQVDSSIGGKVAVNLSSGKNLIGSFYPPRAVVTDVSLLATLDGRQLVSGMFEILKTGVIGDLYLFELLEKTAGDPLSANIEHLQQVIGRSIGFKAEVVSEDERESGRRRLLNYGHTIGHGLETALQYQGLTHGEAVAWGMIGANAIAVRRKLLDPLIAGRIEKLIRRFSPARIPQLDSESVRSAISHDKKFLGGRRVMVFPRSIGNCEVFSDVTPEELEFGLEAALEAGVESSGVPQPSSAAPF